MNESHRKAFMNRIEFVFLKDEYPGTTKFPYDEFDLAHYLLSLYEEESFVNDNET